MKHGRILIKRGHFPPDTQARKAKLVPREARLWRRLTAADLGGKVVGLAAVE